MASYPSRRYIRSKAGTTGITIPGQAVITAADYAAIRTLLSLGSAAQSSSTDFAASVHNHTVSQLSDATANGRSLISAADYSAMRSLLSLVPGASVQAYDATLAALAAWDWSSGVEVATMTADDTLAILRVGTGANNLVQLDGTSKLPAVDGSALTNIPAGTVADGSITNAKLANVATATIKGRTTAGTGVPEDLTAAQARTILSGTAALDMVRLDASARLPAVSGRNLTELERLSCPFYANAKTYLSTPAGSSGTVVLAANTKYDMPFWVTKERTFTELAMAVTTLGTASSIRVGLRNADSDGLPTTLIHEIATPFDASSTGKKTAVISQTLSPGMYYFECVASVNCTVVAGLATGNWGYRGRSIITGVSHCVAHLSRAFTYGALPSDETGASWIDDSNSGPAVPIVGIR